MNLEDICSGVREVASEVAGYIRTQRVATTGDQIEVKERNSFVTNVDKTAEQMLVKRLGRLVPEAGFIAEEGTSDKRGDEYDWIIDPLDGTTNFIHQVPCYCISIALMRDNKIVLGVIYEVNLSECFYAWEGSSAYMNEDEITVSNTTNMEDSLVATGFPYKEHGKLDQYMELFKYLCQNTRGLRRLGSAATDLAYLACGRFDSFYQYGLGPWDVAAGAFIVQQAGGKVTDFHGTADYIFGADILASNGATHGQLLGVVEEYFNCKFV